MNIQHIHGVPPLYTNTFLIITNAKHGILIDAAAEPGVYLKALDEAGATLTHILLTHGHYDHVGAVAALKKATGCKVYMDPVDAQGSQLLPLTPRRQGGKALAGEVTETSKKRTLTEKEFSILRRHTRRKLTELAGELLQGHAEVSPMHTTNVDACKYCKYSSVCGFEGAKNEGKMDNDEVLAYLRREDRDA